MGNEERENSSKNTLSNVRVTLSRCSSIHRTRKEREEKKKKKNERGTFSGSGRPRFEFVRGKRNDLLETFREKTLRISTGSDFSVVNRFLRAIANERTRDAVEICGRFRERRRGRGRRGRGRERGGGRGREEEKERTHRDDDRSGNEEENFADENQKEKDDGFFRRRRRILR